MGISFVSVVKEIQVNQWSNVINALSGSISNVWKLRAKSILNVQCVSKIDELKCINTR